MQRGVDQQLCSRSVAANKVAKRLRLYTRRLFFHEAISRSTQTPNSSHPQMFEIEQSTPNHHRRRLAGRRCEVTFIDEQHTISFAGQVMKQAGPADAATDDQDIESSSFQAVKLVAAEARHL